MPRDPSEAVDAGMKQLFQKKVRPADVAFFSHGTTVGTNALLQDRGARVGALVTGGLRGINDIYQGAMTGPSLYDLYAEMPKGLLEPRFCEDIHERIDFRGKVLTPLDQRQAREAVARLVNRNVESIAVCLLHSFMNPEHETRLKAIIKEQYPAISVSLSTEVIPQIREYLRLSTTLVNASIAPVLARYLGNIQQKLVQAGVVTNERYVMQCNGGVSTFGMASTKAVPAILSGPAAGVIAGRELAVRAGFRNAITFDVGGTSSDIALLEDGEAVQVTTGQVGKWEAATPLIDINTIGAGGGSIAWIDNLGVPKVGPRSAGADPGPACYDKGGTDPTVTDANLVLGYLNAENFLGGKIKLNRQRAEEAIRQKIGIPLGIDTVKAAEGILRIVNVNMEQAIKAVSSERGYDLRQFALVAFGGAGPVHGGMLAAALGIPTVLVPPAPGLTSAMGLLMSDVRHDYARSRLQSLAKTRVDGVNAQFDDLKSQAVRELLDEGFSEVEVDLTFYLDLRYSGQGYELIVPAPGGHLEQPDLALIRSRFDEMHEKLFGHKAEAAPVDIVNYRVVSQVKVPKLAIKESSPAARGPEAAVKGHRHLYFGEFGGDAGCPIYERDLLGPGHLIPGPCVIEQMDSSTVICPGQSGRVDRYGNIIITVKEADLNKHGH